MRGTSKTLDAHGSHQGLVWCRNMFWRKLRLAFSTLQSKFTSRMHPFNLHVTLGFFSLKVPLTKSMLYTRNTPHETRLELNIYMATSGFTDIPISAIRQGNRRDFLCFTRDSNGSHISWQSGRSVIMRTIRYSILRS